MSEQRIRFDDGEAYERLMAPWSRKAGAVFLEWLSPALHRRWLEVGCGTGAFTGLVRDRCTPAELVAFDPSREQIAFARSRHCGNLLAVADSQQLPFRDSGFDYVVSALVLNFIPDRERALAEMRRVCTSGGVIAAYVWDFAGRRSPTALGLMMRRFGIDLPGIPGTESSTLDALAETFAAAELADVQTTGIEVDLTYPSFDDFVRSQTPSYSAVTAELAKLSANERERLFAFLHENLPVRADGTVHCTARAHAVAGRAPLLG